MDTSIPPWQLLERLGDDEVVVVDCRSTEEAERFPVQIPGSLRMALEDIRDNPHALPDDELIVVYDGTRDGLRARMAARILKLAGRYAVTLDGGLVAWLEAGFASESVLRRGSGRTAAAHLPQPRLESQHG